LMTMHLKERDGSQRQVEQIGNGHPVQMVIAAQMSRGEGLVSRFIPRPENFLLQAEPPSPFKRRTCRRLAVTQAIPRPYSSWFWH
jgi:hypothetical protein